jgi:uncharacterized protein
MVQPLPLDAERLQAVLDDAVRRLRAEFGACDVYLFGSYAEGRAGPQSDLDFLVVVPDSDEGYYERVFRAIAALSGLGVPKDVIVYSRSEYEQRMAAPASFARVIAETGKLLHAA